MLYLLAIVSTCFRQWIAGAIYCLIALIWLVPDKRIKNAMAQESQ